MNRIIEAQADPSVDVSPSENDEQELLHVLMGIGRLIEHNVRVGYEKLAKKKGREPKPFRYESVLRGLEEILPCHPGVALTRQASYITNALVHSNFKEVYRRTEESYALNGVQLYQTNFSLLIDIDTTITRRGTSLDMKTLTAQDSDGNPVPTKPHLPGYGDSLGQDFLFFYKSGCFLYTYDVLKLAYESTLLFRYE